VEGKLSFQRHLTSGNTEKAIYRLWNDYKQRPIRAPRHLWRLFHLHREFDFTPPERSRWGKHFPPGQIPQCATCQENCCKGPHNTVLLRLVDVARFVDRGWTDYMTHEKPTFSKETLEKKPLLRETLASFHWRVFPILKQDPENKTCTLLDSAGRCSIHPDRPWICRVFPYYLDLDAQALGYSERCQSYTQAEADHPIAQELEDAAFHSFFVEKIRDLILLRVYREELDALGITRWLNLDERTPLP
jgi:Fe-S-cluster containining protein